MGTNTALIVHMNHIEANSEIFPLRVASHKQQKRVGFEYPLNGRYRAGDIFLADLFHFGTCQGGAFLGDFFQSDTVLELLTLEVEQISAEFMCCCQLEHLLCAFLHVSQWNSQGRSTYLMPIPQ